MDSYILAPGLGRLRAANAIGGRLVLSAGHTAE